MDEDEDEHGDDFFDDGFEQMEELGVPPLICPVLFTNKIEEQLPSSAGTNIYYKIAPQTDPLGFEEYDEHQYNGSASALHAQIQQGFIQILPEWSEGEEDKEDVPLYEKCATHTKEGDHVNLDLMSYATKMKRYGVMSGYVETHKFNDKTLYCQRNSSTALPIDLFTYDPKTDTISKARNVTLAKEPPSKIETEMNEILESLNNLTIAYN